MNQSLTLRVARVVTVASMLVVAMAVPAVSAASGPESRPTTRCDTSFDSYAVDASALSACGIGTSPLLGTARLPDGGVSYRYRVNGTDVKADVPPAGFNAATADASTRARYGIPGRPVGASPETVAAWTRMVSRLHFVTPARALHTIPLRFSTSVNFLNWSGFAAVGSGFTQAGAAYVEPTPGGCSGGSIGIWAGLGGISSSQLAQNGTAQNAPGLGLDQAWYEILPSLPVAINFHASQGWLFEVMTSRFSGSFLFFFYNQKTDDATTYSVTTSAYSGSSAEAIVERPKIGGGYTALENFGAMSVRGTANLNPIGNFTLDRITMVNSSGVVLAKPGALAADHETFTDTWKACQ